MFFVVKFGALTAEQASVVVFASGVVWLARPKRMDHEKHEKHERGVATL
jgi:hypothetical protein